MIKLLRFKTFVNPKVKLVVGVRLPKVITIDEYKADTDIGKFQLINKSKGKYKPMDILAYLEKYE